MTEQLTEAEAFRQNLPYKPSSEQFLQSLYNHLGSPAWVGTFQTHQQMIRSIRRDIENHLEKQGIFTQPVTPERLRKAGL